MAKPKQYRASKINGVIVPLSRKKKIIKYYLQATPETQLVLRNAYKGHIRFPKT